LTYWVREVDLDGYRCDATGFVPTDFWNNLRRELDGIKPVFMLADWESRDLHAEAFDMTYGWSWNETMHRIAMGTGELAQLKVYYAWNEKAYPRDAITCQPKAGPSPSVSRSVTAPTPTTSPRSR
jgi:pullulanase/glycogen debranching enzyme